MNHIYERTGFNRITEQLAEYTNTASAREKAGKLRPYLSETELMKNLRETTEARTFLEEIGTPPIPIMEHMDEYVEKAVKGELLLPEQIEETGMFLAAVKRLKTYLEKGKDKQIGLAFYEENLVCIEELRADIERSIRSGSVDDYASPKLRELRKKIKVLDEKIQQKADHTLKANRKYAGDAFVVSRNGRICIPIKKQYKGKVPGTVIDQSATGSTLFVEPKQITQLCNERDLCRIEEDGEVRRILYVLADSIAEWEQELKENIRMTAKLDFIFAKGKLSEDMDAVEPKINLDRYIYLEQARHPLLDQKTCVPVNIELGNGRRGIVITGPNTGGKTVAIKTAALLSIMASSGLHIPCVKANIALNSQVLCDIGDGQNISDNLSTFSAHISNVMDILRKVNEESLVVLDELGSGMDPAEGMGIAIAILEQLRKSGCLFLVTTHYPEVTEYANRHPEVVNARMAFDRESLKPLYRLEVGKSGKSCALYIAKRLGVPADMLKTAAKEAYGTVSEELIKELGLDKKGEGFKKEHGPSIQKRTVPKKNTESISGLKRGDSVTVCPEGKIGIVVEPEDEKGNVVVQIQKEKRLINHRRLKLKVASKELYPEDYDFSIIFDSAENRKKRHQMSKHHQESMIIESGE